MACTASLLQFKYLRCRISILEECIKEEISALRRKWQPSKRLEVVSQVSLNSIVRITFFSWFFLIKIVRFCHDVIKTYVKWSK